MNGITMEKWLLLGEADRIILRNLGISPETLKKDKVHTYKHNPITVERRLSTRNTAPDEYYVKIFRTCGCCKTKETTRGKMAKRKVTDTFLSFQAQDIPEGEIFRQLAVQSTTCPYCEDTLMQLSVSELTKIIVTLHEVHARRCAI